MNALALSELLNALPDDMIVSAYRNVMQHPQKDAAGSVPAHTEAESVSVLPERKSGDAFIMPRWVTAAALAACLTFAAGFGIILLRGHQNDLTMQSSRDDVEEIITTSGTVTTSAVTTTASAVTAQPVSETRRGIVTLTTADGFAKQDTSDTTGTTTTGTEPLPSIAGRPYDPEIAAKYQLGDVTMDGIIDEKDTSLLRSEFETVVENGGDSLLTPEQLFLGDLVKDNRVPVPLIDIEKGMNGYWQHNIETDYPVSWADLCVLMYYTMLIQGEYDLSEITPEVLAETGHGIPDSDGKIHTDRDIFWRYTDTSEETVSFADFGALPVHVEDFTMFGYQYGSYLAEKNGRYIKAYYRFNNKFINLTYYSEYDPVHMILENGSAQAFKITLPEKNLSVTACMYQISPPYKTGNLLWDENGMGWDAEFFNFTTNEAALAAAKMFIGIHIPETHDTP